VPPAQVASPPHTLPQVPQLVALLDSLTHAPLQFVVPEAQFRAQAPAEQTSFAGQAVPQPPQLAGSLCSSTQAAAPPVPQAVSPALQPQEPFVHSWEPLQALAQAPQLAALLPRFTHALLQSVSPVAQVDVQTLFEQTSPPRQAMLHPPQLRGSDVGSTQTPLQTVPVVQLPPSVSIDPSGPFTGPLSWAVVPSGTLESLAAPSGTTVCPSSEASDVGASPSGRVAPSGSVIP